MHSAGCCYE